jgi:hypothetical protein
LGRNSLWWRGWVMRQTYPCHAPPLRTRQTGYLPGMVPADCSLLLPPKSDD